MKNHKVLIFTVIALVVTMLQSVVFAAENKGMDPDRSASLTLDLVTSEEKIAAEGAEVTVYEVAKAVINGESLHYELTDEFKGKGLDMPLGDIDMPLIEKIVSENNIKGITKVCDKDGNIVFDGLDKGLYYIKQTSTPEDFTSFNPFLSYLPNYENGEWIYDVKAEPKIVFMSASDLPRYAELSVKKVWIDDGKTRPASVTIELKNEDGVYDTVILNADNNWTYQWKKIRTDKKWSVEEKNIPSGYVASYTSDGFSYTVTNTAASKTEKLAQTGQVNWPIPVFLFAGLLFTGAGLILIIKQSKRT